MCTRRTVTGIENLTALFFFFSQKTQRYMLRGFSCQFIVLSPRKVAGKSTLGKLREPQVLPRALPVPFLVAVSRVL
jgi:hypothetical protein